MKAIAFLNLRGVGVTIEEVFEAAKALEPEEEGCSFNFIVLDISVEYIPIVETVHPALVKTSSGLIRFIDLRMILKQ